MEILLTDEARQDLFDGHDFYERQAPGLGSYFLDSLFSDIDSLHLFAGIHRIYCGGQHRMLAKRFPFAIYYALSGETAVVRAILDCRRRPSWIRSRLRGPPKP